MKKSVIAIALAAVSASMSSGAFAQSASSNIDISGTAGQVCQIPSAATFSGTNVTQSALGGQSGTSTLAITSLIDSTTAKATAASATLTYAGAMCNYTAFVSIKANGSGLLQTAGSAIGSVVAGTFLNRIDYTVDAAWGTKTASVTTDGTANKKASTTLTGANIGDLVVTFAVTAGSTPVLQGSYSDTIVVQIGAAL